MIESVSVEKPVKVVVSHNGVGHGAGIYIDKVTIQEQESGQEYVFPCGQWFDDQEGDKKTQRELMLAEGGVEEAEMEEKDIIICKFRSYWKQNVSSLKKKKKKNLQDAKWQISGFVQNTIWTFLFTC